MGITPVLFSASEAAEALGVNRRTIQRWVHTGLIKPAKTMAGRGGHVFTADEVVRVGAQQQRRKSA